MQRFFNSIQCVLSGTKQQEDFHAQQQVILESAQLFTQNSNSSNSAHIHNDFRTSCQACTPAEAAKAEAVQWVAVIEAVSSGVSYAAAPLLHPPAGTNMVAWTFRYACPAAQTAFQALPIALIFKKHVLMQQHLRQHRVKERNLYTLHRTASSPAAPPARRVTPYRFPGAGASALTDGGTPVLRALFTTHAVADHAEAANAVQHAGQNLLVEKNKCCVQHVRRTIDILSSSTGSQYRAPRRRKALFIEGRRRPLQSPVPLPPSSRAYASSPVHQISPLRMTSFRVGFRALSYFSAAFSSFDGVCGLRSTAPPSSSTGSSTPLQPIIRSHKICPSISSSSFCLSFNVSLSFKSHSSCSTPYFSRLCCQNSFDSSSCFLGRIFRGASTDMNSASNVVSKPFRRSRSALTATGTSVPDEPVSSLLHPTRFWPCAQQLHRGLLLSMLQRGEIAAPTDVQERSVPPLLAGESSLIVAPTGSGKTLAWALPLVSTLLHADSERLAPYPQQPRLLVLVPSRELAQQLLQELRKHFSAAGVSIASAAAGQSYVREVRALTGRSGPSSSCSNGDSTTGADVLIATPARLLLHLHKRNVNLGRVRAIVVEEADTLCDTFYEQELLFILRTLHQRAPNGATFKAVTAATTVDAGAARADRKDDNRLPHQTDLEYLDSHGKDGLLYAASGPYKTHQMNSSRKAEVLAINQKNITCCTHAERPRAQMIFVAATKTGALGRFLRKELEGMPLTFICTPDAHLTNPGVQQVFVPLRGEDRLSRLLEVLDEKAAGAGAMGAGGGRGGGALAVGRKTIVFCNTVNSCRAVDLTLLEKGYRVSCLHGMMPFNLRKISFRRFKGGQTDILVCTNVASRGLDISGVDHVIMFDFPQSLADYLHRSGRTARGGEKGRVTLLFSKKNIPLLQQIQNISKATVSSPELRHASPRMRRLLRLEERWRELTQMRNPKRKIGGRRKLGLPPSRKAVSPRTRWLLKKLHFRMKADSHMRFLRSRGILLKKELLPRHPRLSVERSDAQQCMRMVRGEDGLLQMMATRRSKYYLRRKAQQSEEGQYECPETTTPIEGRTYAEEKAARPSRHHRKTYF